jgi:predicted permease
MDAMWQDLRHAYRMLAKNPGFTVLAVLTLALGIAINATMFSLVSAFLLRRPAVKNPDQLISVSSVNPAPVFEADTYLISAPNYRAWRGANHVCEDLAAADEYRSVGMTLYGQSEALSAAAVSPNYFKVLGVSPELGRVFSEGEDQPGSDHLLILSHALWVRRFASDPRVVGQTVRLNRENYTVAGVMPANFQLLGYSRQLWIPLTLRAADLTEDARKNRSLQVVGRLKPGTTVEQARAEFQILWQTAVQQFPESEKGWGVAVRAFPDFLVYSFGIRTGLAILMTTVGFVLLIACGNVAGLLLARAAGRQKELAVRISLGASRRRIVSQLLTESLGIALLGGAVGLLLATWGIRVVRAGMAFNDEVGAIPIQLDGNVLLFGLAVSLAAAVLSGIAPALKASRTDINSTLKDDSRSSTSGQSQSRLRTVLVSGEIALAMFLLIGTGLLIRAVFQIQHQSLGFQTSNLLTASLTLDNARYPDASRQILFVRDVRSQIQKIPGVQQMTVTSELPATFPDSVTFHVEGQPERPGDQPFSTSDFVVDSEFFSTAGIPLLLGRTFTNLDTSETPHVVVVNQEFVHRYFADQEPLGKRIRLELSGQKPQWSQVVGVVANVKTYSEAARNDPQVYEGFLQRPQSGFSLMIRTSRDPNSLASDLRKAVAEVDNDLPVDRVMSMAGVIERQRGGNTFFAQILGLFAFLALILSAIGIYGVIAYSVGLRTAEIGIRMALGARQSDVLGIILWQGLKMAAIGGAIGLALALPLPRLFEAIFFDIHLHDPGLYVVVPATVVGVAFLATYVPARRAARVDPMVALHHE